jgi:hypothetical protein
MCYSPMYRTNLSSLAIHDDMPVVVTMYRYHVGHEFFIEELMRLVDDGVA